MVLEFICSEIIAHGKKINIPGNANCYRLKAGKIKFFRANLYIQNTKFKKLPENARQISFRIERNAYNIEYGRPEFYDSYRNGL